jgi:hypothetical protein
VSETKPQSETTPDPDQMGAALTRIKGWADAYPVDVFRPLTDDEIRTARQLVGDEVFSRLHASWARHILSGIERIAKEALS